MVDIHSSDPSELSIALLALRRNSVVVILFQTENESRWVYSFCCRYTLYMLSFHCYCFSIVYLYTAKHRHLQGGQKSKPLSRIIIKSV